MTGKAKTENMEKQIMERGTMATMNTKEIYTMELPENNGLAKFKLDGVIEVWANSEDEVFIEILSLKEKGEGTEAKVALSSSLPDPFPFFDLALFDITPLHDSIEKLN